MGVQNLPKRRQERIAFYAMLFFFPSSWASAAYLKQLHVITRHGSRPALNKDGNTLLEEGGDTITPLGQKQLYDLGVWLRNTYNVDKEFLEVYDPSKDRLESSNLDRTLTSANSLSMSLFPLPARHGGNSEQFYQTVLPHEPSVPVYSRQEENDVYLRAYRNCPQFTANLQRLYATSGWKDLEQNSEGLLKKLAEKFPYAAGEKAIDKVSLVDLWNYYDPIHVARTECNPFPDSYACQVAVDDPTIREILTDVEFNELEVLVEQTEQLKFGIATAKNLLGSNLLWQILNQVPQDGRFFLYSAHAPTILGFFSTLKQWNIDERFVDYGSAVIIEVYEDAFQTYSIRLLYKAASKNEARYIPFSNMDCDFVTSNKTNSDEEIERCLYDDVKAWAERNTLTSTGAWCEACGNEKADVCLKHYKTSWTVFEERTDTSEPEILAAVFFGGAFAGAFFMFLCCLCVKTLPAANDGNSGIHEESLDGDVDYDSNSDNGEEEEEQQSDTMT